MKDWRAFMAKYYPEGDLKDAGNVVGYGVTLNHDPRPEAVRQRSARARTC